MPTHLTPLRRYCYKTSLYGKGGLWSICLRRFSWPSGNRSENVRLDPTLMVSISIL